MSLYFMYQIMSYSPICISFYLTKETVVVDLVVVLDELYCLVVKVDSVLINTWLADSLLID